MLWRNAKMIALPEPLCFCVNENQKSHPDTILPVLSGLTIIISLIFLLCMPKKILRFRKKSLVVDKYEVQGVENP